MSELLDNLTKKLTASGIHPLRQLGRAVGVYSPTNKKKDELIEGILAIATNRAEPAEVSRRGAPPKSGDYDRELLAEIERCRRYYAGLSFTQTGDEPSNEISVSAPQGECEEEVFSGILECDEKFWFVRTRDMLVTPGGDVFVHSNFINRFRLRTGDFIVCKAKKSDENGCPSATFIVSVNGGAPGQLRRIDFERLTPCYPEERFTLECENGSLSGRIIDLFCPIGRGQRALIAAPSGTGKTTLLKHIAGAIAKNYPAVSLIAVLVDERPEEVTDFRRAIGDGMLAYSTFDRGDDSHVHAASLALEHAKRLVEDGRDVVILLDSITRLVRAYNNCLSSTGKILEDLDGHALIAAKRFFGAARNTEEGGSLTIIATAVTGSGNALDEVICEEFGPAANMQVSLSPELAGGRIYPAVDIKSSGSRKEELLLSADEMSAAAAVRSALSSGASPRDLLQAMASTADNATFISQISQILEKIS